MEGLEMCVSRYIYAGAGVGGLTVLKIATEQ